MKLTNIFQRGSIHQPVRIYPDAAQDWLPADVVPTSGLVEGAAVLATQSVSDELLKTLPKAVP